MVTSMGGTVSRGENQTATTTPMNSRPDANGGDVVGIRLCGQHVKPTSKTGQARHHIHPARVRVAASSAETLNACGEWRFMRETAGAAQGIRNPASLVSPMYRYGRTVALLVATVVGIVLVSPYAGSGWGVLALILLAVGYSVAVFQVIRTVLGWGRVPEPPKDLETGEEALEAIRRSLFER